MSSYLNLVGSQKGHTGMFIAALRYLYAWQQYAIAVRELSGLSQCELADIGITRSDIPRVAWEQPPDPLAGGASGTGPLPRPTSARRIYNTEALATK